MLFKQFEIIKRNKIKKFLENHEQYITDYRFVCLAIMPNKALDQYV